MTADERMDKAVEAAKKVWIGVITADVIREMLTAALPYLAWIEEPKKDPRVEKVAAYLLDKSLVGRDFEKVAYEIVAKLDSL